MIDITNADRAGWALDAITGFVENTRVDTATDAISDLIVDLLHLARARGLQIDGLVNRAAAAMIEELTEDEEGSMDSVKERFRQLLPDDN